MPNRRPICVRRKHRKHREPACTFESDPEEDFNQRRDSVEVEHPDMKNPKQEGSACEMDQKKKGIKRKVETQKGIKRKVETLEDCEHVKEATVGGECSVGTTEDPAEDHSEVFDFNDWVEEQKRIIREISVN